MLTSLHTFFIDVLQTLTQVYWSREIKLLIKYNTDGVFVGESPVHLTSYSLQEKS